MEAILSFALLGFLTIILVGAFLIVRDKQAEWQIKKDGCKKSLTETNELASPRQPALVHYAENAFRRDCLDHSSSDKQSR